MLDVLLMQIQTQKPMMNNVDSNPGVVNWISMEQRGLKREGELTDGARLVR